MLMLYMRKVSWATKMEKSLRYELKMVFDGLRLDEVRSWVFFHTDAFRIAYPPRQVNNIYFDTIEKTLMMEHIDGGADRSKVRFRWYGEDWVAKNGQFEVKRKIGQLGYKHIQSIPTEIDLSQLSWNEIIGILRRDGGGEWNRLLDTLTPVIINQYQREYFESMNGLSSPKIRLQ